jgi:hypothetical protein
MRVIDIQVDGKGHALGGYLDNGRQKDIDGSSGQGATE